MAELLFWPALVFYGEAVLGYVGEARQPGAAGRAAIWGVRLGWLAQTALLCVQAAREAGFPWGTWAGSLNLFVWLVVARAGGGTGIGNASHYSNLFLVVHVGLVLLAFAGLTLAACLSGLYLWQERRLKRRAATILCRPVPALVTLDRLVVRLVSVSVPLLTVGIAVGLARLLARGDAVDALMVATLVTWGAWAGYLVLRLRGLAGRRAAYVALAGFLLVIVVRLALPAAHFA